MSVADLMKALDSRSYGPLLLLPGVLGVSPVGAIPGVSIVTGTLIVLVASQAAWGRSSPWLPRRLLAFSFSRQRLASAIERLRPWLHHVERVIRPRWGFLLTRPMFRISAGCCMLLAMTFYPLALIPIGVALPGSAVILFSLAWTSRDALLLVLALTSTVTSVVVGIYLVA